MAYQTILPSRLAEAGLKVELVPGWETRGYEPFNPGGAVCHWTAGPRGTTGRPSLKICTFGREGLPGPLCNVYLDRNGVAVVVAAGRANHAGVGGWRGLTGNSSVFGTEAESGGDGDWTPAQRIAYPKINAAYARIGGFGAEMVCGHNEWAPSRKIDIRDWQMPDMRASVDQILRGGGVEEDDMFSDQDRKNLDNVNAFIEWWLKPDVQPEPSSKGELTKLLRETAYLVKVRQTAAGVSVDPKAVADAVLAGLSPEVAKQVADELQRRLVN